MYNTIDIAGGLLIAVVAVVVMVLHGRSEKEYTLDSRYFQRRWAKVKKMCVDRKLWYKAIVDADDLLDEALKQRHFKGKSTGERMVSAQHFFSHNDSIWLSHKLKNRIEDDGYTKLNKQQTIEALASFRLALKDLGALGSDRKRKSGHGK